MSPNPYLPTSACSSYVAVINEKASRLRFAPDRLFTIRHGSFTLGFYTIRTFKRAQERYCPAGYVLVITFSSSHLGQDSPIIRLRTHHTAISTDLIHAGERSQHTCTWDNQNPCRPSLSIRVNFRRPCSWSLSTARLRTSSRLSRSGGAALRLQNVPNSMFISQHMISLWSQHQRRAA
jgi:hypothetical protein